MTCLPGVLLSGSGRFEDGRVVTGNNDRLAPGTFSFAATVSPLLLSVKKHTHTKKTTQPNTAIFLLWRKLNIAFSIPSVTSNKFSSGPPRHCHRHVGVE